MDTEIYQQKIEEFLRHINEASNIAGQLRDSDGIEVFFSSILQSSMLKKSSIAFISFISDELYEKLLEET